MLPKPNMRTLKATRKVAWVEVTWKCFSSGMMATVKFEPLTLAMNENRQMVAYVVTLAAVDQLRGSFGSLDVATGSQSQYNGVPRAR